MDANGVDPLTRRGSSLDAALDYAPRHRGNVRQLVHGPVVELDERGGTAVPGLIC